MIPINDYQIKTLYESNRTLIYRAQNKSTKENVIFKILNKEYPTSYELKSIKHEYEILKKLENIEGIPSPYELSKFNNYHTIIMDDTDGTSLKQLMQTNSFCVEDILSIAIDIAVIIGEIHAAHIIHKDINPGNIIFDHKSNRISIIDYGISTQLTIENPVLQSPNVLEGSLNYISPEQTGRMNRSLDYRTDYYSFGITLYELLTQTIPFKSKDPMELIHSHIAKQPVPPHEINKEIPKTLSNIVMKLVSKNAEDRYQSSGGIILDLQECKEQIKVSGAISEFSLAQNDIPERFQIPQKLYGRVNEVNTLLSAFDRIILGTGEMILISGYSGIGKTVLVKEIYKPITRQRGYFISGKFDQFQRDIPYRAIVEAFSDLARQMLTEKKDILNNWVEKIISALGPNGQVIVDIIPDMELVIGKQPDILELGPAEAQNRFNHVFQNFISVFTDHDHLLVMFIDDLQWADMASLKLIQLLMKTKKQSLFIIGAYRDNEVNEAHPLIHIIDEIKKTDASLHEISLSPLSSEHISQLICDSFYCSKEKSDSLTNLVHNKTGGIHFLLMNS